MIQVLLHDKFKKCDRSPYEVEDILTSVVFGALEYCTRNEELLQFLKKAINVYGNNRLDNILQKVEDVKYEFWPDWKQEIEVADSNNTSDKQIALGSEPDILLKIKRDNNKAWILVEVKLQSGKSSPRPTSEGPITDQLAKYWLQLKERAKKNNAKPIALIYLTKHISMPKGDFDEAKGELKAKIKEPVCDQFYWLSWREFPNCISEDSPRILQDVKKLLMEKWQLIPTEQMKEWPKLIDAMINQWHFTPFICPELRLPQGTLINQWYFTHFVWHELKTNDLPMFWFQCHK